MTSIAAAWVLLLSLVTATTEGHGQILRSSGFDGQWFAKLPLVTRANISEYTLPSDKAALAKSIADLCEKTSARYKRLAWESNPCADVNWQARYQTVGKNPLIYAVFGKGSVTSLYIGGVHPDELTPIHLIFRYAAYLKQHPELYEGSDRRIVVAPLVNPDSFFLDKPTRVNLNGVDLNRNFGTLDWYSEAISAWRERRQGDIRYFPGYFPNSEIETKFQAELVEEFAPGKIISVHAPLGFLDYDGPGDQKPHTLTRIEQKAKEIVMRIARESKNYKIVDYSFYPGSLGNFAGNEREIPTITLELETENPSKVEDYWAQFRDGLVVSAKLPYPNSRLGVHDTKTGDVSAGRGDKTAQRSN